MDTDFTRVTRYYNQFDEWSRLMSDAGTIEFQETLNIVLPKIGKEAKILDVGSGPGRYSIAFINAGHQVTLYDIAQSLIDQAKCQINQAGLAKGVGGYHVGNAIDLSRFPDRSFDAIFCCGPFYHLLDPGDRNKCANELLRVCRRGGLIIIGFIPRFSAMAGLMSRAVNNPDQVSSSTFQEVAESGTFRNENRTGFQEGYYPLVSEFREFWTAAGLQDVEMYSTRSFIFQNEKSLAKIKAMDPTLFQNIIEAHRKFQSDERFIEAGGHALLVGNNK